MIEGLERRCLLSATVAPFAASSSLVQLKAVTPAKINAGATGTEVVTVRNPTAASVTESVTVTLAPSVNGTTPAGAYTTPSVTETVTIKKHGSVAIKVPFSPPSTLTGGKYRTIATVDVGSTTVTAVAPGAYTLIVPPAPTTTPSLIGHYSGLITSHAGSGGGNNYTHQATFIWQTTAQTTTSLTGTFSVGSGQTTGTMTGSELTTGAIKYTLTSADINYTITGTVSPDGQTITGSFQGTFVNNIFKKLNGKFKLTLQTS